MTSSHPLQRTPSRFRRPAQYAYLGLGVLFLSAIIIQVFLAGAGVFSNAAYLGHHARFVEWFQPLPLFLLLAAFPAKIDRFTKIAPALAFGALVLQYEFVKASPSLAAGLHTVNALFIFWLAVQMVRRGWTATRGSVGTRRPRHAEETPAS